MCKSLDAQFLLFQTWRQSDHQVAIDYNFWGETTGQGSSSRKTAGPVQFTHPPPAIFHKAGPFFLSSFNAERCLQKWPKTLRISVALVREAGAEYPFPTELLLKGSLRKGIPVLGKVFHCKIGDQGNKRTELQFSQRALRIYLCFQFSQQKLR